MAVDGLTLSVGEGEVRGLIGPNGSGKTTTINLLSGLYRADAGEVRLRGERVDRLRPHQIAGRGVARTFQISKVWGNMTVLENLLVPAFAEHDRGAGRPTAEILDRARRLLDLREPRPAAPRPRQGALRRAERCSCRSRGGSWSTPSACSCMDEPFAGVHPTIKDTIIETILRMNREEGVTFLIVSHEMGTCAGCAPASR